MTDQPKSGGKTAPVRAAVYVRISSDRGGAGLGVARQEEDCRALCERLGWRAVEVYADNDVSAYSGKPRPAWERLNSDIAAGLVDAIACWHADRLTRSPRELEDVIDLHDRHGAQLATCTGEIDLSTPTGRLIARTLGAAARHEAEHKAEWQRRQLRQAAEQGKAHGGQRGYGYTLDCSAVIEDEAVLIRECTRRALGGETIKELAVEMNPRGFTTVKGRPWTRQSLRLVLLSARISGRREYRPTDSHEPGLDGDMWERWEHPQMTSSARRALILACVHAIDVQPAGQRRWDPDRIQPDWIA